MSEQNKKRSTSAIRESQSALKLDARAVVFNNHGFIEHAHPQNQD